VLRSVIVRAKKLEMICGISLCTTQTKFDRSLGTKDVIVRPVKVARSSPDGFTGITSALLHKTDIRRGLGGVTA